jgi:hypothetical protein
LKPGAQNLAPKTWRVNPNLLRTPRRKTPDAQSYEDAEAPRAKIVPCCVRPYIHSDEIQSTVTESSSLSEELKKKPAPFRCSRPHSPLKVRGGAVAFAKGRGKPPLPNQRPAVLLLSCSNKCTANHSATPNPSGSSLNFHASTNATLQSYQMRLAKSTAIVAQTSSKLPGEP